MSSSRPSLLLVPGFLLALIVSLPSTARSAPVPAPAKPTPVPTWTRVSDQPGTFADAPGVARDPNGALYLVYTSRTGVDDVALKSRALTTSGAWLRPISIVTKWRTLAAPDIEASGGAVYAFWAGRGPGTDPAPVNPGTAWSAMLDKGVWKRLPLPSSASAQPADSAQLSSTTDAAGQPWFTWSTSTVTGIHGGFDLAGPELETPMTCCELGTNIARDEATSELFVAARSTAPLTPGVLLRRVSPEASSPVTLSGSATGGRSIARATRIAAVSRPTLGGVHVAYCASVPTCRTIRVANQRDRGIKLQLKTPARPESVAVARGPEGRLWVTWTDTARTTWASRSNEAFTRWGSPVSIPAPAGTTSAWHATGDGSRGPLDVILNATTARGTWLWHARMHPGLTIAPVTPVTTGRMNIVRVRVSDAGDSVRAVVNFRGALRTTTADGVATLVLPPDTPPGRYPLTATATGYAAAAGTLVVR